MQPILTIALRAAQGAADKLSYTLDQLMQSNEPEKRQEILDKAIEDAAWRARKAIRAAHGRHHIDCVQLGFEESRDWDGQSRWLIDVCTGELNLRCGYPAFLVNIALYSQDKIDCAVVYNPANETFISVAKGRGVHCRNRRVRAQLTTLPQALCGVETKRGELLAHWCQRSAGVRTTGCGLQAFIDLALGHVQIAIAEELSPAEINTALLIVQEAGALSGDLNGRPLKTSGGELLAASPKLFKQLLSSP